MNRQFPISTHINRGSARQRLESLSSHQGKNPCNPLIRLIRDSDKRHISPRSGFRFGLDLLYYTHCAPLERGNWTHRRSIDIALRWRSKGFSMKSSCKSLNPKNPDSDGFASPDSIRILGTEPIYRGAS